MIAKPVLLDLYCGADGAGVGYSRAGFDVYGIDLSPQRNYPFWFDQQDALNVLASIIENGARMFNGRLIAAIHASPPCQRYSYMAACRPGLAEKYPDLVEPTRKLLIETGLPYVIENVPPAPLVNPITLCGHMFGLELYRHRGFESNVELTAPEHPRHVVPGSKAGHWKPGTVMSVSGHIAPIAHARRIMGIDWTTREELAEAIPPAYTECIGRQLMKVVSR